MKKELLKRVRDWMLAILVVFLIAAAVSLAIPDLVMVFVFLAIVTVAFVAFILLDERYRAKPNERS